MIKIVMILILTFEYDEIRINIKDKYKGSSEHKWDIREIDQIDIVWQAM